MKYYIGLQLIKDGVPAWMGQDDIYFPHITMAYFGEMGHPGTEGTRDYIVNVCKKLRVNASIPVTGFRRFGMTDVIMVARTVRIREMRAALLEDTVIRHWTDDTFEWQPHISMAQNASVDDVDWDWIASQPHLAWRGPFLIRNGSEIVG